MRIESKDDWWAALEKYWEQLMGMVDIYHPASKNEPSLKQLAALPITASAPEKACTAVRANIAAEESELESPSVRFAKARSVKDHETLGNLLSATWFGIPESMGAHSIPGFGVLCDLCSENWVFDEEEAREET